MTGAGGSSVGTVLFGIGFAKQFIRTTGGVRVWYLDEGTPQARALFDRVGKVLREGDFDHEIWRITPFIDRVIPGRYDFDWEREWRVPGGFHFTYEDVSVVFTPSGVEELPKIDAIHFHPKADLDYAAAVPFELATRSRRRSRSSCGASRILTTASRGSRASTSGSSTSGTPVTPSWRRSGPWIPRSTRPRTSTSSDCR